MRLRAIEVLLVALELAGFLARQLPGLQALLDAFLLVGVALGGDGGGLLLGLGGGCESASVSAKAIRLRFMEFSSLGCVMHCGRLRNNAVHRAAR